MKTLFKIVLLPAYPVITAVSALVSVLALAAREIWGNWSEAVDEMMGWKEKK